MVLNELVLLLKTADCAEKFCQLSSWQRFNPLIQFFKFVRRHVITMTMNSDSVIKGFNVFKNQVV